MLDLLNSILSVTLLALGFGFVIFWHELGHFLAAKYVGIKVEQFAVGFGQALFAWRKGIGWRIGTTRPEYEKRIKEHLAKNERAETQVKDDANVPTDQFDAVAARLGLGETEYRLNWIPLGGYVKMLGQDDMNPGAVSEDPRAYPQKSVGERMLVISAGVIMNIILAAILFMILFTIGHRVPPAVIGGIQPGSPAQRVTHVVDGKTVTTSLHVGDVVLELDGARQDDFTKLGLTAALADPNEATPIVVRHIDGTTSSYMIAPEKNMVGRAGARGFLQLGIEQPHSLRGPDPRKVKKPSADEEAQARLRMPADYFHIQPGDKIVSVDGQPLNPDDPAAAEPNDYYKLDRAVQAAGREGGRMVELGILRGDGRLDSVKVQPHFVEAFGARRVTIAGMEPRTKVVEIMEDSPAKGVLLPGDVIVRLVSANDPTENPTFQELTETLDRAGQAGQGVEVTVLRGGKLETFPFKALKKVDKDRYGLGFGPGYDLEHLVVAGSLEGSPAAKAGIPDGATLTAINGTKAETWYDVRRLIADAPIGQPIKVTATQGDKPLEFQLTLAETDVTAARNHRFYIAPVLALSEQNMVRKEDNPLKCAWLGVTETRDFILQFYVTIRRMFDGSVSYTNLMGPLGIFDAGAKFAFKGTDWLIWFLAMISANLAVVNFLPIPVVDGGHFVFLCLEKIQGKPVSQRMQSIAQVVGLALLLGVFLLVTYQDINRMFSPY